MSTKRPHHVSILEEQGHNLHLTTAEGWEPGILSTFRPNLILVDLFLDSNVSGISLIRTIRGERFAGNIFLVCPRSLPGHRYRSMYVSCIGGTGVIHTPLPDDALMRIVGR